MSAEEIFARCIQNKDGPIIAKKLAKLYVAIHFNADYASYISQETDSIFLELANRFVTEIKAGLTQTTGRHAATLAMLFLSEDLSEVI